MKPIILVAIIAMASLYLYKYLADKTIKNNAAITKTITIKH